MRCLALTLMLAGCTTTSLGGNTDDPATNSGSWWDAGSSDDGTTSTPTDPFGEDGDFEDDDFEDDEEAFAEEAWFMEIMLGDDGPDGAVEGYFKHDGTNVVCEIEYEVTYDGAGSGCTACDTTWAFTRTEVGYSEDGGGCEAMGALGLAGTSFQVGTAGGRLWRDLGNGWAEGGFAEQEGQELWMEVIVGGELDDDFDEDDEGDEDE